jgi:hypothetical protein
MQIICKNFAFGKIAAKNNLFDTARGRAECDRFTAVDVKLANPDRVGRATDIHFREFFESR